MILALHGLYGSKGASKISTLVRHLEEQVDIKEFAYGYLYAVNTYSAKRRQKILESILAELKDGDSVVAHSFGCVVALDLLRYLEQSKSKLKLNAVYLLNAAADKDMKIYTKNCNKVYNFYDPQDRMLTLAKFVPLSILGGFGRQKYPSTSSKVKNIRIRPIPGGFSKHGRFFKEPNLSYYGKFIKWVEKGNKANVNAFLSQV